MAEMKLTTPVETEDGRLVDTLSVRTMRVRDLARVQRQTFESDFDKGLAIFAVITGEPIAVIENLDIADFVTLSGMVEAASGKLPSATTGSS